MTGGMRRVVPNGRILRSTQTTNFIAEALEGEFSEQFENIGHIFCSHETSEIGNIIFPGGCGVQGRLNHQNQKLTPHSLCFLEKSFLSLRFAALRASLRCKERLLLRLVPS